MDATRLAAELLEPIPANRTFGIRVLRAVDAHARVALQAAPTTTNVIGSLHSSGLVALIDAAGLAAIIAAATSSDALQHVVPLGTRAQIEFLAPARGDLVAQCTMDDAAQAATREFLDARTPTAHVVTDVEILDADHQIVCRGAFTWSLRRQT